jgi:glucosyltransferase
MRAGADHDPTRSRGETVLHIVKQWLPVSETFIADALTHSRHESVVVSCEPVINRDRFPRRPVVPLDPVRTRPPARLRRQLTTLALLAVERWYRPQVVHVHFGYHLNEAQGLIRRRRLPTVVSLHGHDATSAEWGAGGRLAGALSMVDAVVVPSQFLAHAAGVAGAPADVIRILPSGVDTRVFSPSPVPDEPIAVFVGRFVEKKGLDVLLDAWPTVAGTVPGARLRVLGYGPLESAARSAGDTVQVVISPDHRTVRDAIRAARVVVTPSRMAGDGDSESLLVVNLEAQASGRPVVTTNHGGIPEFVREGETALVVPENDARALAAAVVGVLTDDGLATRLGAAGPTWAANFDIRRTTGALDDLYDELVRRPS